MADLYQVEFKGSRKEVFYNTYYHSFAANGYVIVQAEQGEDMGRLRGKLVTEPQFDETSRPRSILRPAGEEDLARYRQLMEDEKRLRSEVVGVIAQHNLAMKIVDVECLFDGGKITFYFTADHRVDFRALVRDLASRYRTRIELRQIGVRDEAKRLDGYGICGRRQCCSSHLRDFAPISTSHAREQDLSLNPSKISGNCGRLLCCLRYEVDMYRAAKKKLPSPGTQIRTVKGTGSVSRVDVFQEEVLFYNEEEVLTRAGVKEILGIRQGRGDWIETEAGAQATPAEVELNDPSDVDESGDLGESNGHDEPDDPDESDDGDESIDLDESDDGDDSDELDESDDMDGSDDLDEPEDFGDSAVFDDSDDPDDEDSERE
jgi:cell fate regulator YaaT (PSP1 superfamily)